MFAPVNEGLCEQMSKSAMSRFEENRDTFWLPSQEIRLRHPTLENPPDSKVWRVFYLPRHESDPYRVPANRRTGSLRS